jgi:fructose-bisphosphate aldolase class 1
MLVAGDKGLLAMDESNPTCNKRFAALGIPQTEEARRAWRELIVTTPGLGACISGAILYDETIRQQKKDGTSFVKIIIEANAQALARYAALCQEAGLVPVVEPEVLMDGEHTLEQCRKVTEEVLHAVFNHLYTQRVMLEGMLLKPNMVLPGLSCPRQEAVIDVADATVRCLKRAVPAAVPGIAFLSGGQSGELASARLNAMNDRFKSKLPWALAFSFARAIQQSALEICKARRSTCPRHSKP